MQILSPAQCRAARALLNWSQPELAQRTGMHVQTISSFESEGGTPTKTTIEKIFLTFENAGVEFLPDSGLRIRSQNVRIYQGRDDYTEFYKDIYDTALKHGGDFCVSNVDERDFTRWFDDAAVGHIGRMEDIASQNPKFRMRILIKEGDLFMPAKGYADYRWMDKTYYEGVSFYVFGSRLAIMIFENDGVYICTIQNQKVADAYRRQFNLAWDAGKAPPKG